MAHFLLIDSSQNTIGGSSEGSSETEPGKIACPNFTKKYYEYPHLVESVRTEKGPRQRLALNLGNLEIAPSQYQAFARRVEEILTGQRSLFEALLPSGLGAAKDAKNLGVAFFVGLVSALMGRPLVGGLVVLGNMTLHGVLSPVVGLGDKLRIAMDSGARRVILPSENKRDFVDLPAELIEKLLIDFYENRC